MSKPLTDYDIVALVLSLLMFTAYHFYLYIIKPHIFGGNIPYAISVANSEIWLRKHKENRDSAAGVLAITTLRGTMTAAVFIGGYALTIAYNLSNAYPKLDNDRGKVRSIIVTFLMFGSFLCWANVIRLASVIGFLVGTLTYSLQLREEAVAKEKERRAKEVDTDDFPHHEQLHHIKVPAGATADKMFTITYDEETHEYTAESVLDIYGTSSNMMRLMTVFFSSGVRLMFISLPFAFYSAGPLALLVTSLLLLACLRQYDHAIIDHVPNIYMRKPQLV